MNDFKIISWDELAEGGKCLFPKGTAVTIGGFDGPHRGHKELFGCVLDRAGREGLTPGIVTFVRPPSAVRNNASYSGDVSTLRLRLKKFEESGFGFTVLIDFSAGFAKMEGAAFFDILIKTICVKYLVVGGDFYCGYRRGLGAERLKELAPQMGFGFDSVGDVTAEDGIRISSTAIREAVSAGDFARAKDLLGYPFAFDIAGAAWAVNGTQSVSAPKRLFTQIFPPDGKYGVLLSSFKKNSDEEFKENKREKQQAVFYAEKDEIRLAAGEPSQAFHTEDLNRFDTIEFICKEL